MVCFGNVSAASWLPSEEQGLFARGVRCAREAEPQSHSSCLRDGLGDTSIATLAVSDQGGMFDALPHGCSCPRLEPLCSVCCACCLYRREEAPHYVVSLQLYVGCLMCLEMCIVDRACVSAFKVTAVFLETRFFQFPPGQ